MNTALFYTIRYQGQYEDIETGCVTIGLGITAVIQEVI